MGKELELVNYDVMAVAYVQHPMTKREKLSLRAAGFRVVDLRFMPKPVAQRPKGYAIFKRTKAGKLES